MTKYSKFSEKSTFPTPPHDSLFCLPPWGTTPTMETQCGFWGTRLPRLSPLRAIGQFPFRLLLSSASFSGVSEAQALANEPHPPTISFSLFPLTLAPHLSHFPRHCLLPSNTQAHSFPHFKYNPYNFHKFISSLNARCLFPVVYLIFPFRCLTDTLNLSHPKLSTVLPPYLALFSPVSPSSINKTVIY